MGTPKRKIRIESLCIAQLKASITIRVLSGYSMVMGKRAIKSVHFCKKRCVVGE